MVEPKQARTGGQLSVFRELPRFTRAEVAALNAAAAIMQDVRQWESWVEEAFSELFQYSQGLSISLTRESALGKEQPKTYTFTQDAVSIGRSPDNDITLPSGSISRRHARVLRRGGELFIEDLASASGTYVQRQKLESGQSRRLKSGDEFLIFPYVFKASLQELWASDTEVAVAHSQCRAATSSAFRSLLGADLCVFELAIHPAAGSLLLALSRPFLKAALSRLTRGAVTELVDGDTELLNFIVISVLLRANRELRFPFECSLAARGAAAMHDEPGIALEATLRLKDAGGRLVLFLPQSAMRRAQGAAPSLRFEALRAVLHWRVQVRLGFVALTLEDLQTMQAGDALLYTPRVELILPYGSAGPARERGWSAVRNTEAPCRFVVNEFFERSDCMEEVAHLREADKNEIAEAAGTVDLAALPVRVHVMLSEVELSLAQLEALKQGSIVELAANPGQVQLVVNGTILGTGELVEIEDRLGVEITRWGQA